MKPGTLTALLEEIAGAPEAELGGAWEPVLHPGAVFGRFELVRELGRGGFGVVWEAKDRELGRSVAFKAVRAGGKAGVREERLLREAEAAARLSHPNIVTLHDVGRTLHGPFLVLELLRGQTLAERLEQGPLPVHEALHVATEMARGVAHAHAQGVIHRDLKPSNVFLCEDGRVKVLDFGLAHAFGQRKADGGSSGYMAPEQAEGAPEDERTDVWALGAILFEMLAGKRPFGPGKANGRAPVLEVPGAPALGELVGRMLEPRPVSRPRDGGEVLSLLSALSAFERVLERSPAAGPVRARRRPELRLAGLLAAGVAIGAVAAAIALRSNGAPLPARGADGRITVAVADFANETGERELDGLSGLLITSLEQSRLLSVLTRGRMLDLARQAGHGRAERIDEVLGREVGRKAGVRALLLVALHRFGQVYALDLRALDPARDVYLFSLKEQANGKAELLGAIDRVSEQARQALREAPGEVRAAQVKVAEATTTSFVAYQHYFRGEQLADAVRYEAALEEYRKAIADDPTFALAHYQIAYLGEFTGLDTSTRKAEIELAIRNVDRVPEKERLLIRAWKAHMDGHDDQAHALYAEVVQRYPQDKEALYMAGDRQFHEERIAEALPLFERALALDPVWEPALMHLTDSLFFLERKEELLSRSRAWVERAPNGSAYRALSLAYLLGRRWDDAIDAARRALAADDSVFSRLRLAEALLCAERYGEVENMLRPRADPSVSAVERAKAAHGLVVALNYQGRWREALLVAETRLGEEGPTSASRHELELVLHIGRGAHDKARAAARALAKAAEKSGRPWKDHAAVLALTGDLEGAAEEAKKLEPGIERSQYEAASAWRRGRVDEALALLRELAARPGRPATALTLWMLAEVAMEAHREQEALAALDRMVVARGGAFRSWSYPRGLYLAALAHERLGDHARSLQEVDHLLGLWKRADPDLPLLAEAKALRRRLAGAR